MAWVSNVVYLFWLYSTYPTYLPSISPGSAWRSPACRILVDSDLYRWDLCRCSSLGRGAATWLSCVQWCGCGAHCVPWKQFVLIASQCCSCLKNLNRIYVNDAHPSGLGSPSPFFKKQNWWLYHRRVYYTLSPVISRVILTPLRGAYFNSVSHVFLTIFRGFITGSGAHLVWPWRPNS